MKLHHHRNFDFRKNKSNDSLKRTSDCSDDLTIISAIRSLTISFGAASPLDKSLYKFMPR